MSILSVLGVVDARTSICLSVTSVAAPRRACSTVVDRVAVTSFWASSRSAFVAVDLRAGVVDVLWPSSSASMQSVDLVELRRLLRVALARRRGTPRNCTAIQDDPSTTTVEPQRDAARHGGGGGVTPAGHDGGVGGCCRGTVPDAAGPAAGRGAWRRRPSSLRQPVRSSTSSSSSSSPSSTISDARLLARRRRCVSS